MLILKINSHFISAIRFDSIHQIRWAHFVINQFGEKVVVSKRNHIKTKREKWQKIEPMGKEKEFLEIKKIELDDRLHCDPNEAYKTAHNKFQQLSDQLQSLSICRETKTYQPPKNTNEIIDNICKEFNDQKEFNFSDLSQKFKFLTKCQEEFNHEVKNSDLHLIKSTKDVRNYYLTPVIGNTKYDALAMKSMSLPPNLHVLSEPIRFNPKTDTFFDGYNAFPGQQSALMGLRAKKKFPTYEEKFIWPDV